MSGFCGMVGRIAAGFDGPGAIATLDRTGGCTTASRAGPDFALAVAALPQAPVGGPYLFEEGGLVAAFAGDLIDHDRVPWDRIVAEIRAGDYGWLADCDGHFAFAIYDAPAGRLHLVGDHFAYRPLFHCRTPGGLIFGTNLPSLLKLGAPANLDERWFHQFMYFGYWPGQATFLEGVRRFAPGMILTCDVATGGVDVKTFGSRFVKQVPVLRGERSIAHAKEVFAQRLPRYFGRKQPIELPLSGGLDSRTILAFLPPGREHYAYTYGAPGCPDRGEAEFLARALDLPHRVISFDEAYEPSLRRLIYEVVWASGGLAWINRAMLPHVYREVDRHRPRTPLIMSGISLDILFRGHNNARGDLDRFLATGQTGFSAPEYAGIFGPRPGAFYDHVEDLGKALNREHGTLADSEGYLNYLVYTLLPSYFSADLEIAGDHATMRVPGWDRAIIGLAYEIEHSTIYLSKFIEHEQFMEFVLQAHLMSMNPAVARVPLQGIPLWVWTRGNKTAYHAFRALKHGPRYLKRRFAKGLAPRPLEDWPRWCATLLAGELAAILRPGCLVQAYLADGAIESVAAGADWPWRVRLASVEVILQLMHNGWDLDALPYPGVRQAQRDEAVPARSGG